MADFYVSAPPSGREMVDLYVSAGPSGREMADFYVSAARSGPVRGIGLPDGGA